MQQQPEEQSFWRSPIGIVWIGFLLVLIPTMSLGHSEIMSLAVLT
jgi:hypothetical protein